MKLVEDPGNYAGYFTKQTIIASVAIIHPSYGRLGQQIEQLTRWVLLVCKKLSIQNCDFQHGNLQTT